MRSSSMKPLISLLASAVFLSMLVFVFATPALGQATTGRLTGIVQDPQGEVVAGANVTVTNQETGIATDTKTTGEGTFVVPDLKPGRYTVVVEGSGFKKQENKDVVVRLGETTNLTVAMTIGASTEIVTVTGGTEEVVNTNSQISASFETRKVQDLPSNSAGGGIDTIALLTPGVVPGFGNVNSNGTTLSVNGQRARSNNFTIDGTDNNDLSIGGPSFFVDNQEQVAEFQIITNNYSAQYGRNQGAIINIINKSGTNEFHGSGFWYHRNPSSLDAMNNIQRRDPARSRRDKFISNVFGATIGGPIKRNKAFFFFSIQDIRQFTNARFSPGNRLAILPSEFSKLTTQYPGNPAINALVTTSVFALVPSATPRTDLPQDFLCFPKNPLLAANCTDPLNPAFANGLRIAAAVPQFFLTQPFVEPSYFIRGDMNITKNNNFNIKYQHQTSPEENFLTQSNGFFGDIPFTSWNINGQDVWTITPRLVNEVKVARQRLSVEFGGTSGTCEPLKGCMTRPLDLDKNYTRIGFSGVRGGITSFLLQEQGPATNLPQGRIVDVLQISETLTWTKGRHTLVGGVDFRKLDNLVPFLPNVNGSFNYSSIARLAANQPNTLLLVGGETTLEYHEKDQFYFFQDDLKVRPNLTLNLGVRYEYTGQPINLLNQITTARESDPARALWRQNLPIEARTVPFVPADKNNWAPRIGFAWSPHVGGTIGRFLFGDKDESVIRGGFSMAYDPAFYNILLNVSTSTPVVFNNTLSDTGAVGAPTINLALPNNATGDVVRNAFQALLQRNTFDPRLLTFTTVSPDFHSPSSQQWSLGYQRQLGRNNVFEVRYVGNRGIDLFQTLNKNPYYRETFNGFTSAGFGLTSFTFPAFPSLVGSTAPQVCVNVAGTPDNEGACNGRLLAGRGLIRERANTGSSSYHSMQSRYNGRLSNQLTWGATYTFSKALDNASEIFSFGEGFSAANPFDVEKNEKSISGFDRRHAGSANVIWDIPFHRDQKGFLGHIAGGWQINSTFVLASGRPFTVSQFWNILGAAAYQDAAFQAGFVGLDALRAFWGNPNAPRNTVAITDVDAAYFSGVFGPARAFVASPTGYYSFNTLNQTGTLVPVSLNDVRYVFNGPGAAARFGNPFGNVSRNSERGPALNQLNLGVFKNTKVGERVNVQLRLEMFNVLNHPASGYGIAGGAGALPATNVEAAGARDGFNDFTGVSKSSRRLQLGLRIVF